MAFILQSLAFANFAAFYKLAFANYSVLYVETEHVSIADSFIMREGYALFLPSFQRATRSVTTLKSLGCQYTGRNILADKKTDPC